MKFLICLMLSSGLLAAAFSNHHVWGRSKKPQLTEKRRLGASDNSDASDPTLPLTTALSRLDQQWKIQQRAKPKSRWTQITLKDDTNVADGEGFARPSEQAYLLEPPNLSVPSCLIVFVGGAGLGQYPQIAYNELLLRISDQLNAAIIAAPYQIGLDHFTLAKTVGELSRKAMIHCEDDASLQYPASIPTYCLGHSLGCKLMSIYLAATDQDFDGIGFMSFNNFAFSQTISMAKQFAETIAGGSDLGNDFTGFMKNPATQSLFNQVLDFASTAVSVIGLEFTPSPTDTERLIRLKFNAARQSKTRMFVFDDDDLDSSQDFVRACQGEPGPSVSGLPGTHLTPVYFKFGIDDLPEETRDMAREATGGLQSASYGNEEELNNLVKEIVSWIKGGQPSRKPRWEVDRPRITGVAETA